MLGPKWADHEFTIKDVHGTHKMKVTTTGQGKGYFIIDLLDGMSKVVRSATIEN